MYLLEVEKLGKLQEMHSRGHCKNFVQSGDCCTYVHSNTKHTRLAQ